MSFNQQLTVPRVLGTLTSRLFALMAFSALALIVAGCASGPPPDVVEARPQPQAPDTDTTADDLTATEAAIAGMNDAPADAQPAQTAQLIRPDAPMNYTVKRGDALANIATMWNTTPDKLRQWNRLPDNRIRIGQKLMVRPAI